MKVLFRADIKELLCGIYEFRYTPCSEMKWSRDRMLGQEK